MAHRRYREIQTQRLRKRIIDRAALAELLGLPSVAGLAQAHDEWIALPLEAETHKREAKWSDALAVEGRSFTDLVHRNPGTAARHRRIDTDGSDFVLRDPRGCFGPRNGAIKADVQPDSGRNRRPSGNLR